MHVKNNDITPATSQNYNDILSLTNCTLLTADTILWCKKIPFQTDYFVSFSIENNYNPLPLLSFVCPTYPPAHPLYLIYTLLIPWLLPYVNLTYTNS